jgi:hypothetical protein
VVWPMPWMYVKEMTTRFCGGMSTPASLAMRLLSPAFVPRNLRFRGA